MKRIKMAGATIDHLVSVTVFIGALLLFIGLFNQTIQTAILYQRHRSIATKCSDTLDGILLNPGSPLEWGKTDGMPTGFGLQDPEFTKYRLSPYSLMRLTSLTGTPIVYPKTGQTYSNLSMGFGNFLFVPYSKAVNYSLATRLLGIDNTYGFQLEISPIVSVNVREEHSSNPLTLAVNVTGTGLPLSNATVSYCFMKVIPKGGGAFPSYSSSFGTAFTDARGVATISFASTTSTDAYAFIAYAHLSGLVGIGYHHRVTAGQKYVVPFIDSFADRRVILAHSYDIHYFGPPESAVFFNATFVILTEDFTLREVPMENSTGKADKVNYGEGQPYKTVTLPTFNPGILVLTYMSNNEYGVVLMPWGLSSMGFSVTFGDNPLGRDWVATETRLVLVSGIAYATKLSMWSLEGYQVVT